MYDDLLGRKEVEEEKAKAFSLEENAADPIATKQFKDKLKKYTDCLEADCSQCNSDCMYAHI